MSADPKYKDQFKGMSPVFTMQQMLLWPQAASIQIQNGYYLPTALALGSAYWYGGNPIGQSWQAIAMGYAVSIVGFYVGTQISNQGY